MRVEITDDDGADPYFLFLWSVSEEEFHELKTQQRLLVDFATFPANLIELLQCCVKDSKKMAEEEKESSEEEDTVVGVRESGDIPRSQKTRSAGPMPLSIVETNPFKQLTHLSLRFFPGDDAAIKAYLAARLAQVGASRRALSTSLKQTSEELQVTQRSEAKLQQELSALGYEAESTLSQEKMKFADELDAQRKAAATALKEREDELNAKIDALVERYEKEVQELSKQKYQHEMQIDHLRAQSEDLSHGRSALSGEVDELRTQNKELDQKVFQQEKQINALQVRADALQQQLADKEEVIKKTTDVLQSAKLHNDEVDESLKMYRDNHARLQQKLELSISEINKVNEDEGQDYQTARTGMALTDVLSRWKGDSNTISASPQFVEEKQLQREEALLELKSTKEDIRKRDEHIAQLKVCSLAYVAMLAVSVSLIFARSFFFVQDTIKELSQKLEDSNKLLASNQQGTINHSSNCFQHLSGS
ncbi:unnamed protein product [Phytophthora lilii]|uniref:Unnamed protein product n=1 Tax=Phytophthora lilii TaxID=2077276 RepID=A0A9W6XDP1_9STRA|nr:unnamed protein product [Phytophthora lilii]